ncbi:MAG: TIGR03857 family LLM class F420-dependent oxidoreductase, partial [Actinomycetia bacterium]|nr:TIGR03857 family LLM class F420-dependent oxidoreductase [Actinomycetes bacterium]
FNVKDAGVMAGAAAAVTQRLGIGTAATNHNTRHPLVTATMATTLHRMSRGRYALGLGRGFDVLFDLMGVPRITGAQIEDAIGIYRSLWSGTAVAGHSGPAGEYPYLSQDASFDERIPVMMMAVGPRTLELAGKVADAVVLHTFMTDETLERSVGIVRRAAEEAGRDPRSVRVWSVLATVHDGLPEELRLRKIVGRLATYMQGYGQVLVRANGWDPAVLETFAADPVVQSSAGALDAIGTPEDLGHLRDEVFPEEWLAASAQGTPERCAARIRDQLDRGADSVILHGATPDELRPVLDAWRAVRPAGGSGGSVGADLAGLPANPGRMRA